MKTVSACMSGDPHYTTFDGQHFDYMGTCPYVFVEPCNNTLPKPYNYFSVKAKNERPSPQSHVSYVREVEVEMYGQKMHVDCSYNFLFNGIRTKMAFFYPNKENAKISVSYDKGTVTIENDQHIRVKFQCYYLCVEIPDEPPLHGADVLCGLAGNRDFDCRDDFRKNNEHCDGDGLTVGCRSHQELSHMISHLKREVYRLQAPVDPNCTVCWSAPCLNGGTCIPLNVTEYRNGFVYEGINSCDNYRKEFTEEYGDSYITEDFLPLTPHPELCMKGVEVTNGSINCEFAEAKQKCQPILEASKGQGPFAKCQSLGDAIIQDAFDNCAYDICQNSTSLCVTFAHFAKVCQTHIPDTPLDWRGELGCSAINCPLNSTFKPCATGCPLTCSSPNYSPHCDKDTPLDWRGELGCSAINCPLNSTFKPCATGCPLTCSSPNYSPHCDKDTPLDWRGELGCSAINCPLNSTFKPCATGCPLTCSSPNYSPHCDKDTPLDWRGELGCSAINCPLNSTFKPCATGCPLTCSSPNYSPHCDKVCTEGCECDPTFVLDNSDPRHPKCVHVEDCGCIDPQGNYHPAGDQWLTDNCTKVNLCVNGTYKSYRRPCSADGFCGVDEKFNHKCLCNKGYSGDGYNCADVDECLDKRTCSVDKNQGKCTNLPGSHICTCDVYYNDGDNCETFLPYRHCADLYTYHNIHEDGAYTIMPPYPFDGKPAFTTKDVYCDMTTQGGGWTLMSNSFTNSMSNKTYQQYVNGFGDAQIQDLWLGLEVIHQMSVQVDTSLRVDIYHCPTKWKPGQSTYCTYPLFKVHDAKSTYAVEIPVGCEGTENTYEDGWLRWDEQVGPIFSAYDSADSGCARYYHNTGWWYDSARLCGSANLNGNRYVCENTPVAGELTHFLKWNGNPISQARLYLRPAKFPDYETRNNTAGILTTALPMTK
ncbi:IgGFc-binding protein [Toxocara canis]|uniref:IgGFc-binding protein n=1 Tax=Toxocara canis TaxID=6265 RepID=A0A0B2VIE0_TOXCA|nr:IgGFc-binding protein [Toxocara canis]